MRRIIVVLMLLVSACVCVSGQGILATNDVYTVLGNTALNASAKGVLANDTGGSGPLSAILASGPAYGSLVLTNNGGFTYVPSNNFTGIDSFTYKATDGQTTSAVATAAIVVVSPGQLFNDTFKRPTNSGSIFPWTLKLATPVPNITTNPSGTWTITNNSFLGNSSSLYTYTFACYNNLAWTNYSVQAQFQVSSTSGNGIGIAGRLNPVTGARYSVWYFPENSPDLTTIGLGGTAEMAILKYTNWTSYTEGNLVPLLGMGTNLHSGKVVFQGSNVLVYFDGNLMTNWVDNSLFDGQPALTNGGMDFETYYYSTPYVSTVKNVIVNVSSATNLPPTAVNDTYTVNSGATLNVPASGVLTNDYNGTGALKAILISGTTFGSLVLTNNGGFTYTPTTNFAGVDAFTYVATDGQTTSGVATVTLLVSAPGKLFNDNFVRPANGSSIFPWINQLGSWSITNGLLLGSCSLDNYGFAYYSANWTDYSVQAQFRFPSTNVLGGAIGGRLNPVTGARYDLWVYPENSPAGPQNGTATLQIDKYSSWTVETDQSLVSLPGLGTNWHNLKLAFRGTNIFAYFDGNKLANLVDDGTFDGQPALTNGGIAVSMYAATPYAYTMSVSNVLVIPVVANTACTVRENNLLMMPKPGVLANALDVFGTNLTAILIAGPTNGNLTLSSNGGFIYTPATNFFGTDGFTIQARDSSNYLGVATATITVTPVVTAPAPMILSFGLTNRICTVTWSSVAGSFYGLQATTNLTGTNWINVLSNLTATGSTMSQTNAIGNVPRQFYRVTLVPGP